jgi:hypothetical protein
MQQSTTDCININVPVLEYVAQPKTCTPVGWGAFYEETYKRNDTDHSDLQ